MRREIFLIRHGQTDYNLKGIVQGRGVDASLNEKGQSQAMKFHQAYGGTDFNHVFISTLKRTYESVSPFINDGKPFTKHAELDEIDWGTHEGLEATPEMRKEYKRIIDAWSAGELNIGIPGGESPLDVQERMRSFQQHFEQAAPAKSLIACHGRAMRVLLCTLLDRPLTQMDAFPHKNLTLYRLQEVSGRYELLEANNTAHLQG